MHRVVVVALDGVIAFDLSTPTEVFGRVRLPTGRAGYQVRVCGVSPEVDAGAFRVSVRYGLSELRKADTVILPGVADLGAPIPEALRRGIRSAAQAGARVASICTGTFLLAATGLLDGRRATTHWVAAGELARRFPKIDVDPNVLFVDEGMVLTSAGATAGIDLCLHMVRRDYGAAVAASAARLSVMPLERQGGQAQFIEHRQPPSEQLPLSRLLDWLEENLDDPSISLDVIARQGALSVRTLSRRFREQTGTTPLNWLFRARVRRAQVLLETTPLSVERIATSVGFGSVTAFRVHFRRVVRTSPQSYRRAFRGAPDRSAA
jgi:transcriptional regulator GlxA family with amidase domain